MVGPDSLRCCDLFVGLSDEELAQVAAVGREEAYAPGAVICAEHGHAESLFVLQSGRVEVCIHLRSSASPDCCVTIEEIEPGKIFGWSSLVAQRRFTASVRALEPVALIALDSAKLSTLFDLNPHVGFVVMKQLAAVVASRLRGTRELMEGHPAGED
ncbi:MAG TPA: cyclic nucleotide-binding domain-containing protein [Anaerolineae bacterium]|nr:cyclic nucleotide-binding domain-containing protein [Anaerolineae bacterium]